MKSNNKYTKMLDELHMSEEQCQQMEQTLLQNISDNSNHHSVYHFFKKNMVAAALAICLIGGISGTVYAACNNGWFSMFFHNAETNPDVVEKLSGKGSLSSVANRSDSYRINVMSNVYSQELKQGLLVCSFKFLEDTCDTIEVMNTGLADTGDGSVFLTADGIVTGNEYIENYGGEFLDLSIVGEGTEYGNSTVYYYGEKAEDGGYLLGVRYLVDDETANESNLQLVLSKQTELLKVALPKTEPASTVTFTLADSENKIIVSDFGIYLKLNANKDSDEYNELTRETEVFHDIKLISDSEIISLNDINAETAYVTDNVMEGTNTYSFEFSVGFSEIIDVSKINSITIWGEKYTR